MRGSFKRYELVERIGVGGMAEVYRANGITPAGSSVPLVIKKILPSLSGDESFRQMFVDEARITSLLDHPNVVRLVDLGRMDDQLFLALDLVDGIDLQRILAALEAQRNRVSLADATFVACEVLKALDYAHTRTLPNGQSVAIVHRDVSPGNVLIARDGSVKLTDFGIAKGAVRGGQTVVGAVKGNLRYIAPEQITGGAVGAYSDVYACGMVLFRMVVGRYPIEFDALGTLVGRIVEGLVPRPREIDPKVPPELDAILAKAISLDPAQRYQSAGELQERLERWAKVSKLALGPGGIGNTVRTLLGTQAKSQKKTVVAVMELHSQGGDGTMFRTMALPQESSSGVKTAPHGILIPEVVDADVEEVTRKSIVRRPRRTQEITDDYTTTDEVRPPFVRGLEESSLPVVKGSLGTGDFVVPDDLPVLKSGEVPMPSTPVARGSTLIEPRRPSRSPFSEQPEEDERTSPSGVPLDAESGEPSRPVPNLARKERDDPPSWAPDLDELGIPAPQAKPPAPDPEPDEAPSITNPTGMRAADEATPAHGTVHGEGEDAPPTLGPTTDSFAIPVMNAPPPPSAAPPPPDLADIAEEERTLRSAIPRAPAVAAAPARAAAPAPAPRTSPPTMAIGGFMGHRETVSAIAIAPSSRYVATASHDQTVRIWDPATRREVRNLAGHQAAVTSLAISPDGRHVVSAGRDKTIRVWDPIAGSEVFALEGHTDWVFSVVFSSDGKQLLSSGADRTVRLWGIAERRELRSFEGHSGIVTQARFLPSWQRQILSASYDQTLRIWNLPDGAHLRTMDAPSMESVRALAVSPEGALAFSGGADCVVRIWHLDTGSSDGLVGHTGAVVAVASPDGNILASASHDGSVKVWDVAARRELKTLRGHRGAVMALAFSSDGKYLLTGGDDRIVAIWQLGL